MTLLEQLTQNIPAQLVGAAAMILLFLSYQVNERKIILIFQVCISICWTVHYGMLGATAGVLINILCFIRNITFSYRDKYRWSSGIWMPIIICAAEVIATVAVWGGPVDILALIGAPLQTTALWMKKPKYIRLLMLFASPLWMVYDYFNGSYVGILTETIVMISLLIAMFRYDIKKNSSEEAEAAQ